MPVNVSVQLSLGRFPVSAEADDTLTTLKTKLRDSHPDLLQVNYKALRFFLRDAYLTDDTKTLAEAGVAEDDILHLVKKVSCAKAGVDTEKPADE